MTSFERLETFPPAILHLQPKSLDLQLGWRKVVEGHESTTNAPTKTLAKRLKTTYFLFSPVYPLKTLQTLCKRPLKKGIGYIGRKGEKEKRI
jgi:hypothetical protein